MKLGKRISRRDFLITSTTAFFTALLTGPLKAGELGVLVEQLNWKPLDPRRESGPAPLPEITAAVDVIVPPDPEIPDDFKGSDYGGDWVLAATLGELGQYSAVYFLNKFAKQTAGKKFINCTPEEQIEAIRQWIRERDDMNKTFSDLLSGILTVSMIGTYEENEPEAELELFESMGWYDPQDPSGTFRIPCEGYPDANQTPVRLKKGLRK